MSTEAERIKTIKKLFAEWKSSARKTLDTGIQIGKLLTEQKKKVGHGKWESWIKTNLPFSHMTATKYMRYYENRQEIKSKGALLLEEAYRLLKKPTISTPDSTEQEAEVVSYPPEPSGNVQNKASIPIPVKPLMTADKERDDLCRWFDLKLGELTKEERHIFSEIRDSDAWPAITNAIHVNRKKSAA